MLKKMFDLSAAVMGGVFFMPAIIVISLVVKLTSRGPVLYWSDRVGINSSVFRMPKFRTMNLGTPVVASHELENPRSLLTPVGGFLRRTSLDELPQLWSILCGDMSIVGPRPALFNQTDLIILRKERGVDKLLPGLTGWAQINGRDELKVIHKVAFDVEYIERKSFSFDLKIIGLTVLKVVLRDSISH